jgi:hypothetical protein
MTKITIPIIPQAREEYDQSQMAQMVQTLEQHCTQFLHKQQL